MNKCYLTITGLAVGTLLLGGCAPGTAAPSGAQPAASQGSTQSPTGTVQTARTPPEAATMVCSAEAKDNITKILGLSSPPKATRSWNGTTYSCQFALPEGTFAMSVKVYPDAPAAHARATTLAKSLNAQPIQGLSNLGLPGYQSEAGTVVFAKDNMTLHVDATTMPATVGTHHVPRADFAYQMATTILACWSEH